MKTETNIKQGEEKMAKVLDEGTIGLAMNDYFYLEEEACGGYRVVMENVGVWNFSKKDDAENFFNAMLASTSYIQF